MSEAAFFVSLVTVTSGLTLATLYVRAGGLRRSAPDPAVAGLPAGDVVNRTVEGGRSRWSIARVAMHGTFAMSAAAFLGLGAVSDTLDRQGAVIGALLALTAAALGLTLFRTWAADRGKRLGGDDPPEQHIPAVAAVGHGLIATATIVLSIVAAFNVW